MAKIPTNRIVAISPDSAQSGVELRSNLLEKLNNIGLRYLHVGAGVETVYVVLPSDGNQPKLEEVAESCNAFVSGSGYLLLETYGFSEEGIESVEQALVQRPIDYDIPVVGSWDQAYGVCGLCGGVGRHIGPPCKI